MDWLHPALIHLFVPFFSMEWLEESELNEVTTAVKIELESELVSKLFIFEIFPVIIGFGSICEAQLRLLVIMDVDKT